MAPAATAAITLLCALWWIFEPIPIPFTSLLPLALFPDAGNPHPGPGGPAYGSPLILLLLGGFMISEAMADSGAHKRIALFMVNLFGARSARSLVMGFMFASAALSMWISNTATTLMLLPVALAVLAHAPTEAGGTPAAGHRLCGQHRRAWARPSARRPTWCSCRSMPTSLATRRRFPQFMSYGLPVVCIFVPLAGLWLTRGVRLDGAIELPKVGAWSSWERRVLVLFALTALAWITRQAPFGGWSAWLGLPGANDASVALLAAVIMAMCRPAMVSGCCAGRRRGKSPGRC